MVAQLLNSEELADQYFPGGSVFMSRGHFAPRANFMYTSWQVSEIHDKNNEARPNWIKFNSEQATTLLIQTRNGNALMEATGCSLKEVSGILWKQGTLNF